MNLITISPEQQLAELKIACDEIISEADLLEKLRESYQKQQPLTIKLGCDPTQPDLHLGHSVVINLLRRFQVFGHKIIFIIGDFTALIGDPTGRSKLRPPLTEAEVARNAQTYQDQVFKILDPSKTQVLFNSQWLNKLNAMDIVKLLATRTLQQLIAREDFASRYAEQTPIFLHEFMYPLLQAYDSLHIKADVEVGGTDQKFNLLLGRELQRQQGQRAQSLILCPLLEGLDGVQKMSKSLGNYIGLTEEPEAMFGKIMSISDEHMLRFWKLLSQQGPERIAEVIAGVKDSSFHPMEAKKAIAEEVVSIYWGAERGKKAREHFTQMFSQRLVPEDIPVYEVPAHQHHELNLLDLSVTLQFASSKSDARRVLKGNGMKLDSATLSSEKIALEPGKSYIFRYGKIKIIKLVVPA